MVVFCNSFCLSVRICCNNKRAIFTCTQEQKCAVVPEDVTDMKVQIWRSSSGHLEQVFASKKMHYLPWHTEALYSSRQPLWICSRPLASFPNTAFSQLNSAMHNEKENVLLGFPVFTHDSWQVLWHLQVTTNGFGFCWRWLRSTKIQKGGESSPNSEVLFDFWRKQKHNTNCKMWSWKLKPKTLIHWNFLDSSCNVGFWWIWYISQCGCIHPNRDFFCISKCQPTCNNT